MIKSYSELLLLPTFEERFQYLRLDGQVGADTFGFQRWLNQKLYHSMEWRRFRNRMIIRDNGCDLAFEGFEILGEPILLHHINPITYDEVVNRAASIFDPENIVSTKLSTHNALHYGNESVVPAASVERSPNDTCPWRRTK